MYIVKVRIDILILHFIDIYLVLLRFLGIVCLSKNNHARWKWLTLFTSDMPLHKLGL